MGELAKKLEDLKLKPKLPTFDELQEGDWVRLQNRHSQTSPTSCVEGYVVGHVRGQVRLGPYHYGCGHWDVVAFKPLRQVVREMIDATEDVPHALLTLRDGILEAINSTRNPTDERTALFAAKAALEVMIARKGKP